MRVSRIRPEEPKGNCHNCHSRAVFDIDFGSRRPHLRLCVHDAKYMLDFLNRRVIEHEEGRPIPVPRTYDEDARGNR
jgi:hypothetical protein